MSDRRPTLEEMIIQHDREQAERLRNAIKRVMANAAREWREKWELTHPTNPDATPSPDDSDDLPDDWGFNHENS